MEIFDSAYKFLREVDSGESIAAGVNKFQGEEPRTTKTVTVDDTIEKGQTEGLNNVRRGRDDRETDQSSDRKAWNGWS